MANFETIGLEAVLEGVSDFISDGNAINEGVSAMGSAFDAGASLISGAGDLIGSAIGGLASAALDLAASAGGALVSFFQDSFAGALEAEQTMARLGQVITSTGGSAGVTTENAAQLADMFKHLAGGSDDAVLSIIDMGLRMGTIDAQEMPSFIQHTLDLGAVMGDAGKAAQLMARAQEDPVGVLGALRKAGILVNETTEAQIKAMVKSGDTAGAYSILMDRVGEATQGAADTMAQTTAGQWAIFQETIADAGETIVGAFLPALMAIAGPILETVVPAISALADILSTSFTNLLNGNIRAGLEGLGESLFEVFPPEVAGPLNDALTWLSTTIQSIVAFVQSNMPLMQATFTTVWTTIQGVLEVVSGFVTDTLMPALATIWEQTDIQLPSAQQTFEAVMAGIVTATQMVAAFITDVLVPVLTAAVAWVVANWPQIQATIENAWAVIQQVFAAISTFISTVVIPAFMSAVDWVVSNWPTIQTTIETVINAVSDVITTVLSAVLSFWQANGATMLSDTTSTFSTIQATIESVITTVQSIITTVLSAIQAFWQAHGDSIMAIVTTYLTNAYNTISTVINNIQAVITTVLNAIQAFWSTWGGTIMSIASTTWTAIQTIISNAITIIGAVIDAFAAAVTGDWSAFGAALLTIWDALWSNFITILGAGLSNIITLVGAGITNIINAFSSVDWAAIGTGIIQGIAGGISNAVGGLVDAAVSAAWNAYNAARQALGISSPSRLFAGLGASTQQGMSEGIASGVHLAVDAARGAATSIGQAFIGASSTMGLQAGQSFGNSYRQTVTAITASVGQAANSTLTTLTSNYQSTIDMLAASLGAASPTATPVPPQPGTPMPPTTGAGGIGGGPTFNYSPVYGGTPRLPSRDFSIMQVLAG